MCVEDEQMVNCSLTKSHAQAAHKEEGLATLEHFCGCAESAVIENQ